MLNIIIVVVSIIGVYYIGWISGVVYVAPKKRFTHGEVLLITQEIEKLKSKDIVQYNVLMNEWKGLISNSNAKVEKASAELQLMIMKIKP